MTQFTANEVRDAITWKYGDKSTRISAMLTVLADMLEAQEKSVPVMVVNHVSSAEHDLPIGMKLYTHPASADAERLAEALRNLVSEWVAIADDGDATLEDSAIGYRACANRLSAMLAAHSAQAQPPAANVTDEMVERARSAFVQADDGSTGITDAIRAALLAALENPNG